MNESSAMENNTEAVRRVVEEEFSELRPALECLLCKDAIKTPMMLPCGHNFCSLCIRRALQTMSEKDGLQHTCCPVCREPGSEGDLRKNIALQVECH